MIFAVVRGRGQSGNHLNTYQYSRKPFIWHIIDQENYSICCYIKEWGIVEEKWGGEG